MTVHSAQLGADPSLGTGTVTLYTVPAGVRTIVKNAIAKNLNGAASYVVFTFGDSAGDHGYYVLYMAASGSDGDSVTWNPWVVLNAGDWIKAVAHAASASVIISGTELDI